MHTEIAELLLDIESELRQLGLWQKIPPSVTALASTEPFAVDTLTLSQWLQFIFVPTLYSRLERDLELPQRCGITPMAEEYYKGSDLSTAALLATLRQIDDLLTPDDEPKFGAD
ncbi:MAG: hypothetical protein ACJAZ0_000466 [Halioglobus sp.]|jgi:uncharacterized protein YqcC (DUF446 family)